MTKSFRHASGVNPQVVKFKEPAEAAFKAIDTDNDGQLSIGELTAAAQQYGAEVQAAWPAARIRAVVATHDENGDGCLDRSEWIAALTAEASA